MDVSFEESHGRVNKLLKKAKKKRRTRPAVPFNKSRSFNTSLNSTFVKASLRANNRALANALVSKKAELQYAQQIIYCLEAEVHKYREALTESRALIVKQKEDFAKVDKIVRQLIESQSQYIDDLATAHDVCAKVMAVDVDKCSILKSSGLLSRPRCKQKPARVLNQAQCIDTLIQPNKTPDPKPDEGSSDTDLSSPTVPVLSSPTEKQLGSLVSTVCEQGSDGAPADLSMIVEQTFLHTSDTTQDALKDQEVHNPDLLFIDEKAEFVSKRRGSSRKVHSQCRDPLLVGNGEDLSLSPLLKGKQCETSEALESVNVTDQQQVKQSESPCQDEEEERQKCVMSSDNATLYDVLDMELTHVENETNTPEVVVLPENSSDNVQDVIEIDNMRPEARGTSHDKDIGKESPGSCDALKRTNSSGKGRPLVEDNQATSRVTEEISQPKKQDKTAKGSHLSQPKKSSVVNIKMARDLHKDSSIKVKSNNNSTEHMAEVTGQCTKMVDNSTNNSDVGNSQKRFTAYMVKPGKISFTLDKADGVNPKGSQSQRKPRSKSNSLLPTRQRSCSKPRSKSKPQTTQRERCSSEVMSVFDIDFSTPEQQRKGKMTSSGSEAEACLSNSACKTKPSYSQFCGRELQRPKLTAPTVDKSEAMYQSPHGIMLRLGDGRRSRSKPRSKNVHYKTKLVTVSVISPEEPMQDGEATPKNSDDQCLASLQLMSEDAGQTPLKKAIVKRTSRDMLSLDDIDSRMSSRKRHICSPGDSSDVAPNDASSSDDSPVVCRSKRRHVLISSDLECGSSERPTPPAMNQRADVSVAPNPTRESRSETRQVGNSPTSADKPTQIVHGNPLKTSKPVNVKKDNPKTKTKSSSAMDQGDQFPLKASASPKLTRKSRSKMKQMEMTSGSERSNTTNQTSPAGEGKLMQMVQQQSSQTPKSTDVRKGETESKPKTTSVSQKVIDITNMPHRNAPSAKKGQLTIVSNTEPTQTEGEECHPSRKSSVQSEKETGRTKGSKTAGQGHDIHKDMASEDCPLLSSRPRRISSQVTSYKEIALNTKLRREDMLASTIYRGAQGPELIKLNSKSKKKTHKPRPVNKDDSDNNKSLNNSTPLADVTNMAH